MYVDTHDTDPNATTLEDLGAFVLALFNDETVEERSRRRQLRRECDAVRLLRDALGDDVFQFLRSSINVPDAGTGFCPAVRFQYRGASLGLYLHSDWVWYISRHNRFGPRRIGQFNPQFIDAREQFFALCEEASNKE